MELETLTEMGIQHPEEISHYDWRQRTRKKDELVIYFERKKGSLRAVSRSYIFGRSLKTVVADGGTSRFEDTYEVSPYALKAMDELNHILSIARPSLTTLQQMMMRELDELQGLVSRDGTEPDALQKKIDKLREHTERLT